MEAGQDASLFLAKMLEELDSKRRHVSYQDLCRSLCARFDLPQLARLRSVLFCTACLDPGFPATLFKDKMKCPGSSQQSKKIMVAADIVTIFNLIQMTGGAARDKLPAAAAGRPEACPTAAACDSCRPDDDDDDTEPLGCELAQGPFGQAFPARQPAPCREVDCADCPQFVPASEPSFLLGVGEEAKARAASLERLQARAPYAAASPQPCEMQRTYFPMTLDSASVSDQDSLPGPPGGVQGTFVANDDDEEDPFGVRSCLQKRTIFKGDFQNLLAVSPGLAGPADAAEAGHGDPGSRKEPPKVPFLNRSFDVPYGSRYLNAAAAAAYSPVPDKRRAKHESLDDLQASTYFGPTPAMGTPDARRCPGGRPGKQTPWPAKSWSLNAEEVPAVDRPLLLHRNPSYEKLQRYPSPGVPAPDQLPAYLAPPTTEQQPLLPAGYAATANGPHAPAIACPVAGLEEREPGTKAKNKSISSTGGQLSSDTSSVGTQTEQPGPEPKPRQDLPGPYGDRHAAAAARPSDDDSEIVSDDISDIFRFLDDMSLSGSTGVIHSSCCDSTGSLSQLPRSDGDSSLERGGGGGRGSNVGAAAAKLAGELPGSQGEKGKRGPDRGGGPRSEEELKTSVCKLVLRIGEIERKLESLSGVRDEISQVLGKLNQLDRKMQPPERARGPADLSSLTSGAPSEESASPRGLPARRGSRAGPKADGGGGGADWCCSEGGGSHSESLRVKALKRSLFARPSSRSLTEEDSATESKVASIANSPRDWRTITYAGRLSLDGEEEEVRGRGPGESKGWRRKSKEVMETGVRVPVSEPSLHAASWPPPPAPWVGGLPSPGREQSTGGRAAGVSWEELVQRPPRCGNPDPRRIAGGSGGAGTVPKETGGRGRRTRGK